MKCEICERSLRVVRTEKIGESVYRVRVCEKCNIVIKTAETKWDKQGR